MISLPKPEKFTERMRKLAHRQSLDVPDLSGKEFLSNARNFIEESHALIQRYHCRGGSGLRVVNCRAIAIDVLIECLFERSLSRSREKFSSRLPPVTLLALGGYGRSELSPFSDVDLMFLYPEKSRFPQFNEFRAHLNDAILYPLWDLNLKVGHSTRTPKEAIAEAQTEVQSKNAMLEARILVGDATLARSFLDNYDRFIRRDNTRRYLQERLKDQRKRRQDNGDSVFLQEPDIKNGVGGLRDYQNILWVARLSLNVRFLCELKDAHSLILPSEFSRLENAYDFLLRVRNELHFRSSRSTDTLNLDIQPKVAWGLGYRQRSIFPRVEAFMRDYYRAAETVFHLSSYIEQRLLLDSDSSVSFAAVIQSRRSSRTEYIDGFEIIDGLLSASSNAVFRQDPIRLIRLFRLLQVHHLRLDFNLQRRITENLHRIDDTIRTSAEANRAFRSILQTKGNVFPVLSLMNSTGVLSQFIPEWEPLHCLVQHEFYHRYTADVHTLNTIQHLDRVFSGQNSEITQKYREALEDTELPALLYLTLLLHDIGKSKGIENHASVGAELAKPVLQRLGVVETAIDRILFLISHHLEMARFWQRFDVDDPQTTQSFAQLVEEPQNLRYLFALTYCDAMATANGLWNSFKDTLHFQLFSGTMKAFSSSSKQRAGFPTVDLNRIKEHLEDLPAEEVDAHLNLLPQRYFSYYAEDDIELHVRMINRLLQTIAQADSLGSLVPVVEWKDDPNLGLTVVHIVTWDRAGLFFKLAGAFALSDLSIISSKALSRADHITIDTFYVMQPKSGIVVDTSRYETFQQHLNRALLENKDLAKELEKKAEKASRPSLLAKTETLPATLPPRVEIYHELSLKRTIIEVEAPDRIGLLFNLANAIFQHGYDITFARISTESSVAVDTFYIEPVQGGQTSDSDNLVNLRKVLLEIVQPAAS